MNYMNVLSDFELRLNRCIPDVAVQNEIAQLNNLLREKEQIIEQQMTEIETLKKKRMMKSLKKNLIEKTNAPTSNGASPKKRGRKPKMPK
jgi:uncharacterized coiled-coil protein SlyX